MITIIHSKENTLVVCHKTRRPFYHGLPTYIARYKNRKTRLVITNMTNMFCFEFALSVYVLSVKKKTTWFIFLRS